jgi:hypothetical protein
MLFSYLLLGVSYYGWGRVVAIGLGLSHQKPESFALPVWLGWAFTLFLFQVLHLFFPLTALVVVPVFVLGLVYATFLTQAGVRSYSVSGGKLCLLTIAGILCLGLAVWLASRAMLRPTHWDPGLYYMNTIRWINAYAIVPGLGNLHAKLAFNQSFFTYVAALNLSPHFGQGRSLANSFLFLLVLATIVPSLAAVIRQPSLLVKEHPFRYVPVLFMLPVLGYFALSSFGFNEATPDLASVFLQLAMFILLARGISEWILGQKDQRYRVTVLVFLAATAVTVKLSNLAFSAVIFGFATAYAWQTSPSPLKNIWRFLWPAALLMLVWCVRGFILSGVPFFPSTIGWLAFDWAVPKGEIINEANWIYSLARMESPPWQRALESWDWLKPWLLRMVRDHMTNVIYPILLTVVFSTIAAVMALLSKKRRSSYLEWAILLLPVSSLVLWFLSAPEPRFSGANFFLAAISSILLFLVAVQGIVGRRMFIVTAGIVFFAGNVHFMSDAIVHRRKIPPVSNTGWHAIRSVPLKQRVTASGLRVYVPKGRNKCWDSPLPCTPTFDPNLSLRVPGRLASGFKVQKKK